MKNLLTVLLCLCAVIAGADDSAKHFTRQMKTAALVTAIDNAKEQVWISTKIALDDRLISAIKRQGAEKAHILTSNPNRVPELVKAGFNVNVPDDDIDNNFIVIDNKLLIIFSQDSCKWTTNRADVMEYAWAWH